jgi:hypothetical protein
MAQHWFLFVFQVKQREEETQCSKMILRFRKDKIKSMEDLSDGGVLTDTYLIQKRAASLKEVQHCGMKKVAIPRLRSLQWRICVSKSNFASMLLVVVVDGPPIQSF